MGWTFTTRKSGISDREFFTPYFAPLEIVRISRRNPEEKTVYMALRIHEGEYANKIFAIVVLYDFYNGEFGFKEITEDSGPTYHSCPQSIINILSPLEELYSGHGLEYAKKWRQACMERYGVMNIQPAARREQLRLF